MLRIIATPKNVQSVSLCRRLGIVTLSELAGVSGVYPSILGQNVRAQLAARASVRNLPDRGKRWRKDRRRRHQGCMVQRMHQHGCNTLAPLLACEAVGIEATTLLPVCIARGGGTILEDVPRGTEEVKCIQCQHNPCGCTARALLRPETTSALPRQTRADTRTRFAGFRNIAKGVLQVAPHGLSRSGKPRRIRSSM